jgi:hypothetical protein
LALRAHPVVRDIYLRLPHKAPYLLPLYYTETDVSTSTNEANLGVMSAYLLEYKKVELILHCFMCNFDIFVMPGLKA